MKYWSHLIPLDMFRPISTLRLSKATITELEEKGYLYVEDLPKNSESLEKLGLNASSLQKQSQSFDALALDIWQSEIDAVQDSIPLCCSNLEDILGDGFQCGVITELSGVPFSGKTQICMQLSVTAQLKKYNGGIDGRVVYIDTRCGPSFHRFKDLVRGCNNYFTDLNVREKDIFDNIKLIRPNSLESLMKIINSLRKAAAEMKNGRKLKLLIIDSLSFPILCCIDDPTERPYYYSRILLELHKLTQIYNICVVIVNELITQLDKDGKACYMAAGGQYVSNYASVRLEMTRLSDCKFAARLVKSPTMPEVTVPFMINQDGVRNIS